MKKILSNLAGVILILSCCVAAQQQSGTPFQIRVNTDANGYLVLSGAAQSLPLSQPTVFANTRLQTDSSGNLLVVVSGAISPTTITCNGSTGTTNTVLTGGNPCNWTASPSITSLSLANGSTTTASINASSGANYGIYFPNGNQIAGEANGTPQFTVIGGSHLLRLEPNIILGWSSGDPTGTNLDTACSRISAGVIACGNGNANNATATINAGKFQIGGVDLITASICSNTAASSDVTGTASKTYFSLNCKVPANSLSAGDTIQFKVRGLYSGNVTDTMIMTVEACQVSGCASGTKVTLATTGALTLTAVSNQGWLIDENLITFTIGTSGTIDTQGYAQYETASTTAIIDSTPNTTTATVATNVDEYLSVSVTFSSSSGNNHASIRNLIGVIQ